MDEEDEDIRPVKVHKIEIMVIDHDNVGIKELSTILQQTRYPNRCMSPTVISSQTKTVDWKDSHPLNYRDKMEQAFNELFSS